MEAQLLAHLCCCCCIYRETGQSWLLLMHHHSVFCLPADPPSALHMSIYVNWTVSLSNWDFAALHKHESRIDRTVKKAPALRRLLNVKPIKGLIILILGFLLFFSRWGYNTYSPDSLNNLQSRDERMRPVRHLQPSWSQDVLLFDRASLCRGRLTCHESWDLLGSRPTNCSKAAGWRELVH